MKFARKLSLSIFLLGTLFIVSISSITYFSSYNSAIMSQSDFALEIVEEVSQDIDLLLEEKVKIAYTLANTPLIKDWLGSSNSLYADLGSTTRIDMINTYNDKWRKTETEEDPFILEYTTNPVSQLLKQQQTTLEGEYGEIFLTNKFGALVSTTAKLSTFAHGQKYWWKGSYNNGDGVVFFDDRGYDESVDGYVLGLVVPIKADDEIIGILKCNLNILGALNQIVSNANTNLGGDFKLIRSGGAIVLEEGVEPLSTSVPKVIFNMTQNQVNGSYIENIDNDKWMIAFAEIYTTTETSDYQFGGNFESIDQKKGNTGETWYIINLKSMDNVLASTNMATWVITISITLMTIILGFVSFIIGRGFSKPLVQMIAPIDKIANGDFSTRIDIATNDEFNELAQHVNSMAVNLNQTTTSIDSLQNEIILREQKELLLKHEEEKYRLLVENVNDAIVISQDNKFIYFNPQFCDMLDYTNEELKQKDYRDVYSEEGLEILLARKTLRERGEEVPSRYETVFKKKGDGLIYIEANVTIIDYLGDHATFAVVRDITKRKQMEEVLNNERQRLTFILKGTNVGTWEWNVETGETIFNKRWAEIIGYTLEEISPVSIDTWMKFTHPEDLKKSETLLEKHFIGELNYYECETRMRHKNGEWIWVLDRGKVSVWTEERKPKLMFGTHQDITARKRADALRQSLEAKLLETRKLEAIGTMVGGVAHEFNNALQSLFLYAGLVKDQLPEDKALNEDFDGLLGTASDAKHLVEQVMLISSLDSGDKLPVNLPEAIAEALNLKITPGMSNIKVELDLVEDCPQVLGDKKQIQRVIENVLGNAIIALEEGGVLGIDLRCETSVNQPGKVLLSISDTGIGMTEDTLNQIFNPFFTTREIGQGKGLGLSIVQNILQNMGGSISADSALGEGSSFLIEFPVGDFSEN